jgi:tetratricopeptide (TPR) repeat protein
VVAAAREARERAEEAWAVADFPDRMQRATETALAALRRADDFAASGSPSKESFAELAAARQIVDDLARHTGLINAYANSVQKFADELGAGFMSNSPHRDLRNRIRAALLQFGLDPIDGQADEVARAVAASRIRDAVLAMLLRWQHHANLDREGFGPLAGAIARQHHANLETETLQSDRLGRVIRSTRQRCGGAYARWQDLLDRNDVPGLVAFAASPEAFSFQSTLFNNLGRDLVQANEFAACRTYLRAAVDRSPHDAWLQYDLARVCWQVQPPDYAEALRHDSAASVQRPDCAWFHLMVGHDYAELRSYDQAVAAYRKMSALSSFYSGLANLWTGHALLKKKDWDGANVALREAIRLLQDWRQQMMLPLAHLDLAMALAGAGRPSDALQGILGVLRENPSWTEDPRTALRYNAACLAMNCADGKGAIALTPAKRPAYRKQALDLLVADLAAIRKLTDADRTFVRRMMQHWLGDGDLASVRDPKAVGQLPQEERDSWTKLWADVRDLRDRTARPTSPSQAVK